MEDFAIGKYFLKFLIDKSFSVFGTVSYLLFGIEATYLLTGSNVYERRLFLKAFCRCIFTSGGKLASLW